VSYKSLDLQTSLPRAAELTPLVQHQQQRPSAEQAMLAGQTIKSAGQQASRLTKSESASKGDITDRQPRGGGGRQPSKPYIRIGGTEQEDTNLSKHPFKGKHIDFMG
jgi:hypothetical protein